MNSVMIFSVAVAAVVLVLVFWAISVYNGLVALRNRFRNAFSQIDVQLQRRYDLIPNLVETAKGFLKHEKETAYYRQTFKKLLCGFILSYLGFLGIQHITCIKPLVHFHNSHARFALTVYY